MTSSWTIRTGEEASRALILLLLIACIPIRADAQKEVMDVPRHPEVREDPAERTPLPPRRNAGPPPDARQKSSTDRTAPPPSNRHIGPAIGAEVPHIETIVPFSSCSPGGTIGLKGRKFGDSPGQAHLLGKFLFGKLKLDVIEWTPGGVIGARVPDIDSVVDQTVQIRVTTANGIQSNQVGCDFRAKREKRWLPADSTHMRLVQCNVGNSYSQGNVFTDPDKTFSQESGSLVICGHTSDGDNAGTDKYETKPLLNGWRFVEWNFSENSGDGGHVITRTGFVPDADQLDLRVNWIIDGGGVAHYSFQLGIEGPRGVPFR